MKRLLFILPVLIVGCSVEKSENMIFEEVEVELASLLISVESSSGIAFPSLIKSVSDGILLNDYGLGKIHKFDLDGNKQFSFGNTGDGPGEFRAVYDFWEFDDYYMVYDYESKKFIKYDFEGIWIEDVLIEFEEFSTLRPVRFEAITPQRFAIPTRGLNGSLFSIVDVETGSIHYFGDALGEYEYSSTPQQYRQAISSRRVPAHELNMVRLRRNQTGIFLIQQSTAILEKYTYSGGVAWEKRLKIPAQDGLFEYFFKANLERLNRELPARYAFSYIQEAHATDEGVAILLYVREDQPLTVVWVPNDGESMTVVTFQGIENQSMQPQDFTISANESYIYVLNMLDGEIYRAMWPL
ncbi:MAG: 6-bladed beta-propeller [Balneolaceae bacterium]